jgi:very-short-patch-repair endonuclease
MAAVLAAGDESVASHRAALVLWNLDGISSAPVELTVPHSHGPVPTGTVLHRTRRIPQPDRLDDIPVTTVERTLLDCCSLLGMMVMTKTVESAIRKRLTTDERLWGFLKEHGGRGVKGTRKLRRILQARQRDTATGSGSETEAWYHIRRSDLPEPVLQHTFTAHDGDKIRPDFYWPHFDKAVEVDGIDAHDSADKLDHDLRRQNKLMDLGIELRRFSARLIRRDPEGFIREVRRFLDL